MNARASLAPLLLCLCVLMLGACASPNAPAAAGAAQARVQTPPRFRRLRRMLDDGLADSQRRDARAVRARSPDLVREGLALIKATLPHDVARTDVPRYLEGRASFGQALKHWVGTVEQGTDAELFEALYDLDAACRGWIDGYLGIAPETSV